MKVFCHLKSINHLLIKLLSIKDLRPFLTVSLLEEMAGMSRNDRRSRSVHEIIELGDSICDAAENGMKIAPLRKVADLSDLHEGVVDWLRNLHSFERLKAVNFAAPPFPGVELATGDQGLSRIVPLVSGIALWEEGQTMHHCVAGYAASILQHKGKRYVYHLELPDGEQATMLIGDKGGRWEIEEIRGVCNAEVSGKIMNFAMQWLERRKQP
jgi:hypothetical protein